MAVGREFDVSRMGVDDATEQRCKRVWPLGRNENWRVGEDLVGRVSKPHCVAKSLD